MALTQVKTSGLADDAVTGAKIADDTVAEANMANDAISLTELKAGTDGQIITWDASGNPTAVGPGTDGQVLTSTGAGSPPAFEALPTSGATLSGSTNNTVVTVTGSNAMAGEANLHFDGTRLLVGSDTSTRDEAKVQVFGTADTNYIAMENTSASDSDGARYGKIIYRGTQSGGEKTDLVHLVSAHDGSADDQKGQFIVKVNDGSDGNSPTERFKISNAGNVTVSDGNLIIGTAGHGIDFSATGDSTGTMSNELLDDYEEGTWDPVLYSTGGGDDFGYSSRAGYYQKVGGVVHYYCNIQWTKGSGVSAGYVYCKGFPFTTRNNPGSYYYIGSNMELGDNGSDPFVLINANGNNTIATYNTGGSTGLTGFAETGDIGSSGSSWFSLTVFTDA